MKTAGLKSLEMQIHLFSDQRFPHSPSPPCLSTELEGPSLSISEKFLISVTHSVAGLTADVSSENGSDTGRSGDGKIPLVRKQHSFHISEETIWDQVCSYYISTVDLNQREDRHFQSLGLPSSLEAPNWNTCMLSMRYHYKVDVGMIIFSLRVKFPHLKVMVGKYVIHVEQQLCWWKWEVEVALQSKAI